MKHHVVALVGGAKESRQICCDTLCSSSWHDHIHSHY